MTSTGTSGTVPTGNTYDKLGSEHPIERRMMRGFLRRLDALLPDPAPATVLEVGAGEGLVVERLRARYPTASVFGLDLPDPSLASEWRERDVRGLHADALSLPVRSRSCDLVLAIEVLEHLPDPDTALAEIARVARGIVILSVPLEPWWRLGNIVRGRYVGRWGNTPGHVQHWTRRGFVRLVGRHLDVQQVVNPLPWTMVAARAT